MRDSRAALESAHLHFLRWAGAAFLSALTYAGILLPLQAVEILHFRIYEVTYQPEDHFALAASITIGVAIVLGFAMGGIGLFRELLLGQKDRSWPWWTAIAATAPAAIVGHVLGSDLPAALPLLAHVVAGGRTSERRWMLLGALLSVCMALALSNPVRHLYAERIVRIFHYHRQRYMDLEVSARKFERERQRGENYLPSIDELPLQDGELFWLGIYSLTHDPWGNPYHFTPSLWVADGNPRPDFGRWNVDYEFSSLGADGKRGGSGTDADITPESVIPSWEIPPKRAQPVPDQKTP